jgi:hypothetical protein
MNRRNNVKTAQLRTSTRRSLRRQVVKVNFLADGRCFFGAEYFRLFGESFNIIRLAHNYYGIYYGIRGLGSRLVASVLRQRYVETAEKDTDYIRNTAWVFTAANGLRLWR